MAVLILFLRLHMMKLDFLIVFIVRKKLELISSLNTLGYIEFDVPCNLNCLEKKLSQESNLQCFAWCIFMHLANMILEEIFLCTKHSYVLIWNLVLGCQNIIKSHVALTLKMLYQVSLTCFLATGTTLEWGGSLVVVSQHLHNLVWHNQIKYYCCP
jgi:hypothetical protein